VVQQPNWGLGRLIVEVSRSHTIRHTHTQGRKPLDVDQLVTEATALNEIKYPCTQRYSNPRSQQSRCPKSRP